ncbi:XRE family transcriptional regulator [Tenacibaculum maritimum]|uniref:XRE family transcriptional regulator n=1 Tax=Tenacibaculum maritimum TaxID=107401 RepID=UPI001E343EDC|nr:XRE family transcriptional regulator [Tenacibaculum maritimum]MCD9583425.1 XRE family transcriptional regulator [Tenacibaculum maritimum]MCD9636758.1 XRE family transcriptional regulator [Tenacibaculum maritimum]
MSTIADKINNKYKHPYHLLAEKFDTNTNYIRKIATGVRAPVRGKGLLIKKELEKLAINK